MIPANITSEDLMREVLRMFREREAYFDDRRTDRNHPELRDLMNGFAGAYQSAADMLTYALDGNIEALRQFDNVPMTERLRKKLHIGE